MALADVYDAITSRRVYRDAMSHAQAKDLILHERGVHFDPDVVEAFLKTELLFIAIKEQFRDVDNAARVTEAAPRPEPRAELLNRILVVDDDPSLRELLTHILNVLGFESICCSSGAEALVQLEFHRPRLVLSDWEMPGMDGLELCRRVRSRPGATHVHFIMLTMHTGKDQLSKAFDAGVDDFINKPVTDSELMARLRAGMRAIELNDDLMAQNKGSQQLNEQLTNLNNRLQKLAITDDLTGLYNRRQAMHRLEEHWSMCHRYQRPVAVVTLDIDHFKQINDRYGHIAGDAVLRGVSEILRKCVRSSDILSPSAARNF